MEVSDQVLIDYTSTTISDKYPTNLVQNGLNLKFQCVNFLDSQSALASSVADGYLSMSTAKSSFLQQLFDAGGITKRVFSMCFRDAQQIFQPAGASAGTLLLGPILDPNRFNTPLVYARNSASQVGGTPSGYSINVRRIYLAIGAQSDTLVRISQNALSLLPIEAAATQSMDVYNHVNGATGTVEVDINKPYTLLHKDLMEPFMLSFFNITGLKYDRSGIPMTSAQFKQLPTIVLQLEVTAKILADDTDIQISDIFVTLQASDGSNVGGYVLVGVPGLIGEIDPVHPMDILVAIPPQHYLVYDAKTKVATPSVIFDTTLSLVGSNVLQGRQVVFDLDQARIGFAEQDCTAGLSLVIADTGSNSVISNSNLRHSDTTAAGNNTLLENNLTSRMWGGGVSVSSDQTITTASTNGSSQSSSGGQEYTDGGASSHAMSTVSSSEAGIQVLSSIAASTSNGGGTVVTTTIGSSVGNSVTHMGLPKAANTENQSMRYGPAVTSPYSYPRSQAQSSTAAAASAVSSSQSAYHPRTGGSNLLWYLMAGAAFLMGFGLTAAGTRPGIAGPQWGRGAARADDGLSVFDAHTTVYGGGVRKKVYEGGNKSVLGGNKSVMGGNKSANRSVMGANRSVMGGSKQMHEATATTKRVYEGPQSTKQVYEGPSTTNQVHEGQKNTKQVYEGPKSDHTKSVTTSKESQHGLFSKGIFGVGKKPKEAPANDGGTVATGWSQNSGSFFSRAQTKAASIKQIGKGVGGQPTKADDVNAFRYGTQSYHGHNID